MHFYEFDCTQSPTIPESRAWNIFDPYKTPWAWPWVSWIVLPFNEILGQYSNILTFEMMLAGLKDLRYLQISWDECPLINHGWFKLFSLICRLLIHVFMLYDLREMETFILSIKLATHLSKPDQVSLWSLLTLTPVTVQLCPPHLTSFGKLLCVGIVAIHLLQAPRPVCKHRHLNEGCQK